MCSTYPRGCGPWRGCSAPWLSPWCRQSACPPAPPAAGLGLRGPSWRARGDPDLPCHAGAGSLSGWRGRDPSEAESRSSLPRSPGLRDLRARPSLRRLTSGRWPRAWRGSGRCPPRPRPACWGCWPGRPPPASAGPRPARGCSSWLWPGRWWGWWWSGTGPWSRSRPSSSAAPRAGSWPGQELPGAGTRGSRYSSCAGARGCPGPAARPSRSWCWGSLSCLPRIPRAKTWSDRGYSLWWTILRFYVRQTVYFIWTRDQFWNQFSLILGLTHYQDRGSVRKVV